MSRIGEDMPRMLSMEGCSGSTFLVALARKLVEQHGFSIAFKDEPNMVEMIKPKNTFYSSGVPMADVIHTSIQHARPKKKTLKHKVIDLAHTNFTAFCYI
jgi:hypothetical protein